MEWRALTVALLDRLAVQVRDYLGVSAETYPLAKILEEARGVRVDVLPERNALMAVRRYVW